jgi:hypothetical protein
MMHEFGINVCHVYLIVLEFVVDKQSFFYKFL